MNGRDRRFTNRAIGVMADGTSVPFWNRNVPKGRDENEWLMGATLGEADGRTNGAALPRFRTQPCVLIFPYQG